MLAWKKDWFATVINPDDYQTEVPFENASGSTQQRRKRKFVNENTSKTFCRGTQCFDLRDILAAVILYVIFVRKWLENGG